MEVESRQDDSEGDTKRADDGLVSGKLDGVEGLFVSGMGISERSPPSEDQIKRSNKTRYWAQQQANNHGVPVIMETLASMKSDNSWHKCSFRFEQNKTPLVLSTSGEYAVMKTSVTAFSTGLSPEFSEYVLQNGITQVILHMNSKLQGDLKATEPDFEFLLQSLEPLELLIKAGTNYPIIVLILSCTGTGDDSVRAGSSALLRIEHGKVYVYGILGCRETRLEVFDTARAPEQMLIRRKNHLHLTQFSQQEVNELMAEIAFQKLLLSSLDDSVENREDAEAKIRTKIKTLEKKLRSMRRTPEHYFEDDETSSLDRVMLGLEKLLDPNSSSGSLSWLFSSDLLRHLLEQAIIVISMTRDPQIQVDQKNRNHWIAKLNYLFVPRFQGERVLIIFVELDEIRGLHKIMGEREPALKGVYTTQLGRAIPPKLEFLRSIHELDVCVAKFPTSFDRKLVIDRTTTFLKDSQPPPAIDPSDRHCGTVGNRRGRSQI